MDTTTKTLLGYAVEPVADGTHAAYRLTGPKGAAILLVRTAEDRHLLYPVNTRSRSVRHLNEVKGWTFFTDDGGKLRPWD